MTRGSPVFSPRCAEPRRENTGLPRVIVYGFAAAGHETGVSRARPGTAQRRSAGSAVCRRSLLMDCRAFAPRTVASCTSHCGKVAMPIWVIRDLLQTAEPAEQRCAVPSRAGIPSCYRARIRRRWSRDRGIPCSAQHSAALLGRLGGL